MKQLTDRQQNLIEQALKIAIQSHKADQATCTEHSPRIAQSFELAAKDCGEVLDLFELAETVTLRW